jgi:hypothetical protein
MKQLAKNQPNFHIVCDSCDFLIAHYYLEDLFNEMEKKQKDIQEFLEIKMEQCE